MQHAVNIAVEGYPLQGYLAVPAHARGMIVFAHGSGSSRSSPRNTYVAQQLQRERFGTLLFDLLTDQEAQIDARTGQLRFNIELLTARLLVATRWVQEHAPLAAQRLGYFGASTGAAAALCAAARTSAVHALVSRGGRPDLAGVALESVQAPTPLIIGGQDIDVIDLNRAALARLNCEAHLEVIRDATHLFEEQGALEQVTSLASEWFSRHLESVSLHAPAPR